MQWLMWNHSFSLAAEPKAHSFDIRRDLFWWTGTNSAPNKGRYPAATRVYIPPPTVEIHKTAVWFARPRVTWYEADPRTERAARRWRTADSERRTARPRVCSAAPLMAVCSAAPRSARSRVDLRALGPRPPESFAMAMPRIGEGSGRYPRLRWNHTRLSRSPARPLPPGGRYQIGVAR